MGRYYWDKKDTADGLKTLDMAQLRKWDYLTGGYKEGTISWSNAGDEQSSINIEVSTTPDNQYIRLSYIQTDQFSGEQEAFNYQHGITTTPCRYGGVRYWFICHLTANGQYCGRRVQKIYKNGNYFGCRHCHNLSYASRNEGSQFRYGFFHAIKLERKMGELQEKIKRSYYAGQPTRKQRQLEALQQEYAQLAPSVTPDIIKAALMR